MKSPRVSPKNGLSVIGSRGLDADGAAHQERRDNWDDQVEVERFERKGGRFVRGSSKLEAAAGVCNRRDMDDRQQSSASRASRSV